MSPLRQTPVLTLPCSLRIGNRVLHVRVLSLCAKWRLVCSGLIMETLISPQFEVNSIFTIISANNLKLFLIFSKESESPVRQHALQRVLRFENLSFESGRVGKSHSAMETRGRDHQVLSDKQGNLRNNGNDSYNRAGDNHLTYDFAQCRLCDNFADWELRD